MNAATFDTHAAVTALRDAGLDETPAVAIVNTVRDAAAAGHSDLATKADLKADLATLETRLRADLATKEDIAAVRAELATIRWTIGLLAAFMFAIGLRVFGIL